MPISYIVVGLSMVIVFAQTSTAAVDEELQTTLGEKCWEEHMDKTCSNPTENIKCLEAGNPLYIEGNPQYYIKLSQEYRENQILCPVLAKEKTCYEEYYKKIIDGIESVINEKGYPKACPNVTKTLQKLKDFKGWCLGKERNDMNITKQIIRFEAVQKRCNDGFYQGFLLPYQCSFKIYKCTNTTDRHYNNAQYKEACSSIDASIGCLDTFKSQCGYERFTEFDIAAKRKIECDSGILFDVCRADIITRDCLTKYYRKQDTTNCQKSLVDATRQCLQMKKTKCKGKKAQDHISWVLQDLDLEC